jgi:hypothetical protein
MLLLMLSYLLISFPALFVTMDTFQMMHMHCWVLRIVCAMTNVFRL